MVAENLRSYILLCEIICPYIAAPRLYQVCSPRYRPTHWALPDRPAFLHTVCLFSFSSPSCKLSVSLLPSLPPPVLSCRSACSSHSPNGNRQTRQHDSDNITPQRTIFVRLLAEGLFFKYKSFIRSKNLRAKGRSAIWRTEFIVSMWIKQWTNTNISCLCCPSSKKL